MEVDEIRNYLKIDRLQLDAELEIQPLLYYEAATKAVEARAVKDSAKIEIDVCRDEAASDIRSKDEKTTEARLNREIDADSQVIETKKEYIKALREASRMEALSVAVAQRSHSLTALSNLYGNNYFSRDGVGVRPNAEKSRLKRR